MQPRRGYNRISPVEETADSESGANCCFSWVWWLLQGYHLSALKVLCGPQKTVQLYLLAWATHIEREGCLVSTCGRGRPSQYAATMDHIQHWVPLTAGVNGVSPRSHGCIDTLSLCVAGSPGWRAPSRHAAGLQCARSLGKGGCGHPDTGTQQDGSGRMEQWNGKASSARLITNKKCLERFIKEFLVPRRKRWSHITYHTTFKSQILTTSGIALSFGQW